MILHLGQDWLSSLSALSLAAAPELDLGWFQSAYEFVRERVVEFARENPVVVLFAVWGAIRTLGTTVRTGYTGLFFHCGRATRVLEPGFVFKIPFFQAVRTMPTRSRTMDVPDQKVTSADGLVWFVDVNLVYRIVDIRKALIEIDDLQHGMKQMLSLSVQEIVYAARRDTLRLSGELDEQLKQSMQVRLEAWGIVVEHAGFTSIKPSPKTLRLTQQLHACEERRRNLERLTERGLERGLALALLGSPPRISRRSIRACQQEALSRRRRRVAQSVRRAIAAVGSKAGPVQRAELRARAIAKLR